MDRIETDSDTVSEDSRSGDESPMSHRPKPIPFNTNVRELTQKNIKSITENFQNIDAVRHQVEQDRNLTAALLDADDTRQRIDTTSEFMTNSIAFDIEDYCDNILNLSGLRVAEKITKDDWHGIGQITGFEMFKVLKF